MGRGQSPAAAIQMTENQFSVLHDIGSKHSTPQQIAKRVKILLLAKAGESNSHIKRELGISLNTVKSWRKRWLSDYEDLEKHEFLLEEKKLSFQDFHNRIWAFLQDLPRRGAPKIFGLAQEQQIIGLACDKPVNHGVEMTDWTYEMLAKVAKAKGIVSTISSSHIGRILKKKSPPTP